MAQRVSPYLVGSACEIKIGDVTIMWGQNITLSDSWSTQQPAGLGDFAAKHNEPISYNGGTLSTTLLRYTDAVLGIDGQQLSGNTIAATVAQGTNRIVRSEKKQAADGNSIAFVEGISPALLMFETSVDIVVYSKNSALSGKQDLVPVYRAIDCYLQSMNSGVNAGSLQNESYTFRYRILQDVNDEPDKQQNNA